MARRSGISWPVGRLVLAAAALLTGTAAAHPPAGDAPPSARAPEVAIVIDDLGWNRAAAARLIALPAPLTLSFLPYPPNVAPEVAAARRAGHEVLAHVPMEPVSLAVDPGPMALMTGQGAGVILDRLGWALARVPGADGINNHMGSRFTADCRAMTVVMEALARRGLDFVDSRTTARSVAGTLAEAIGVGYARRDVFLDNDLAPERIARELARLETIADRRGYAIAIGHPHPTTIAALKAWLPAAARRGIRLVPVSRLVDRLVVAAGKGGCAWPPAAAGRGGGGLSG